MLSEERARRCLTEEWDRPAARLTRLDAGMGSRTCSPAPTGKEDEPGPRDYDGAPSGSQCPVDPRPGAATGRRRANWSTRGYIRGG
jgi:hypothetical protein